MAETTATQLPAIPPLTVLAEEERMFQSTSREFAQKVIRPHVKEMDEQGIFKRELIDEFFAQGFMGIVVPEAYGGSGGRFFMSILTIEEVSRMDASAGAGIGVQSALGNH